MGVALVLAARSRLRQPARHRNRVRDGDARVRAGRGGARAQGSAPLDARRGGPRRRLHEAAEGVRRHRQHEEPLLARARFPRRASSSSSAGPSSRRPAGSGRRSARTSYASRCSVCGRAAYKLQAFVLSSTLAAAGGIVYMLLYSGSTLTVTQPNFTLMLLLMVVIGGAGSRWGAVLGGILYTYLDDRLIAIGSSSAVEGLPHVLRTPLEQPLFLLGVVVHPHRRLPAGRARRPRRARPALSGSTEDRERRSGRRVDAEHESRFADGVQHRVRGPRRRRAAALVQGLGYDRRGFGPAARAARGALSRRGDRQPRRRRERRARRAVHGPADGGGRRSPCSTTRGSSGRTSSASASAASSRRSSRSPIRERVAKLVLCSTMPGGPRSHPMPAAGLEAFGRFPTMEREAGLRLMVENSLGARGVRDGPSSSTRSTRTGSSARRPSRRGRPRRTRARRSTRTTGSAAIAVPTLVLHGGADNVVDPRNARAARRADPGCARRDRSRPRPPHGLGGLGARRATRHGVPACTCIRSATGSRPHARDAGPRRDRVRRSRDHLRRARRGRRRVRGSFAEAGLKRGDRVATLTGNSPEHVQVLFACAQLGLILLPLSWRLAAPELRYQLDDAEPSLFLVEDEYDELARATGHSFERLAEPRPAARHPDVAVGGRRSAAPDLHVGHDRQAEGRAADARELLLDEPRLRSRDRRARRRRRAAGAAAVPRRRAGTCRRCSPGGRARP